MSYRCAPRGDTVVQDVQRGINFLTDPVGAATSFLTNQILGSIFGEDTHMMYLRWLQSYQAAEAAGRKRSAVSKRAIARSAYLATPAATRLSTPTALARLARLRRSS